MRGVLRLSSVLMLFAALGANLRGRPIPGQAAAGFGAQNNSAHISGRVLDDRGRPVVGVDVLALPLPLDGPPRLIYGLDQSQIRTTSDVRGEYELDISPLREYVVAAYLPHHTGPYPSRADNGCLAPWPPYAANFAFGEATAGFDAVEALVDSDRHFMFRPAAGLGPLPTATPGAMLSYVTTFAPSVSSPVDARRVHLAEGRAATDVDIQFQTRRTARLEGQVTWSDGAPFHGLVQLVGDTDFVQAWADPNGRFVMMDAPEGAYVVSADVTSDSCDVVEANPPRWRSRERVAVSALAPIVLDLRLASPQPEPSFGDVTIATRRAADATIPTGNAIVGRITDDRGEPVDRALVRVTSIADQQVWNTTTDLDGRYSLHGLPPASYALAASRHGHADTAFGRRHRGEDGTVIMLEGVSTFEANLSMPRVGSISGVLRDLGVPFEKGRLVEARSNDGGYSYGYTDSSGHFTLKAVPAGSYVVSTSYRRTLNGTPMDSDFYFPGATDRTQAAQVAVAPGQHVELVDMDILEPRPSPTAIAEDAQERAEYAGRQREVVPRIELRTDDGSEIPTGFTWQLVPVRRNRPWESLSFSTELTFTRNVLAFPRTIHSGTYLLRVTAPQDWSVRSAMAAGRDALDLPFEASGATMPELRIVVTHHVTRLNGVVRSASGALTSAATVVVFSRQPDYWTALSRRIQVVRPRSDGSYAATGLPPGDYLVSALRDIPYGQRVDAAFLRSLASRAARAALVNDRVLTLNVTLPGTFSR